MINDQLTRENIGNEDCCPIPGSPVSLEAVIIVLLSLSAYPGILQFDSRLITLLAQDQSLFRTLQRCLPETTYFAFDHLNGLFVSLATLLLFLYLITDYLICNGHQESTSRQAGGLARLIRIHSSRIKGVLLGFILIVFVGLPTVYQMGLRSAGTVQGTHDGGVLQTEAAMDYLLQGKNPYLEDYRGTEVERNNATNPYWINYGHLPIIHHLPYLPFSFLSALPVRLTTRMIYGGYDQRFFYLLLTAASAWILCRLTSPGWKKRLLVAAVLLNPYFTPFLREGRNDVLPFFLILLCVVLLKSGRSATAMVVLALACSSKQFAWVFLPFVFLFLAGREASGLSIPELAGRMLTLWKPIVLFCVISSVIILPFLLWSPAAFVDDVLSFNAGTSEHNYPLGGTPGYGSANLVLNMQLVESRNDYFPFIIPILLFCIPTGLLMLFYQRNHNTLSMMLAGGSLTLLSLLFFSRLFHDNHFGLVMMWITVAVLADNDSFHCRKHLLPGSPTGNDSGDKNHPGT